MEAKLNEINDAEKNNEFAKIIESSSKLTFLFKLMKDFQQQKKRVLIFSMSKKMLTVIENIIQHGHFLSEKGKKVKYMRIDGDTEINEREAMCNTFNKD